MVILANEFNKCPAFDQDLKLWAHKYPELDDIFFNEAQSCERLISALASLKEVMLPVDEKKDAQIQYAFSGATLQ